MSWKWDKKITQRELSSKWVGLQPHATAMFRSTLCGNAHDTAARRLSFPPRVALSPFELSSTFRCCYSLAGFPLLRGHQELLAYVPKSAETRDITRQFEERHRTELQSVVRGHTPISEATQSLPPKWASLGDTPIPLAQRRKTARGRPRRPGGEKAGEAAVSPKGTLFMERLSQRPAGVITCCEAKSPRIQKLNASINMSCPAQSLPVSHSAINGCTVQSGPSFLILRWQCQLHLQAGTCGFTWTATISKLFHSHERQNGTDRGQDDTVVGFFYKNKCRWLMQEPQCPQGLVLEVTQCHTVWITQVSTDSLPKNTREECEWLEVRTIRDHLGASPCLL